MVFVCTCVRTYMYTHVWVINKSAYVYQRMHTQVCLLRALTCGIHSFFRDNSSAINVTYLTMEFHLHVCMHSCIHLYFFACAT
jgi:hypothetical protein